MCITGLLYPHHKMWGGLYWIRFVASVGQSVRPSPILVRSITPLLMEGFSLNFNDTFTSTRGCAEPMLPMCHVKVKVTVKGQIINKQYYTLCRVRSITPLLMEGFPSNLNDTFTSTSYIRESQVQEGVYRSHCVGQQSAVNCSTYSLSSTSK